MAGTVRAYILHCDSPKGEALLAETLDSLLMSEYAIDITVIENGSDSGLWKQVIRLPNNQGVASGYNYGLSDGIYRGADYILLLNNDITVHPAMVTRLVECASEDVDTGIVCPRIFYDGSERMWYDGGKINLWTGVIRHEGIRKIGPPDGKAKETQYACGAAMMVKANVIRTVGYFDPSYNPAYCEDADYSIRARRMGWKIKVVPKAKMWHKISQSIEIL